MAISSALPGLSLVTPKGSRAADGTCGEACSQPSRDWYFAEGYTGDNFQEYLCILNPQEASSHVKLNLLYNSGASGLEEMDLPPRSRVTFDINAMAGKGKEVSIYLESAEPVVAERPMYFTYQDKWKGCTVTSGTTSMEKNWYFAEGCTRDGFEEWLLLANSNADNVEATVFLVLQDGGVTRISLNLPPRSRQTIFINQAVGPERDVGTRVETDELIFAERVMYFKYHGMWPGGHASSGLSQAGKTYLFAEGYTGAGFEEWLSLYAPRETCGADGADVSLNCLFKGSAERSFQVHLDPDRRLTLDINQLVGAGKDVSMELSSHEPFLAERPMYFNYNNYCRGGHVSKGIEASGKKWYLAEGTTRPGFQTYLCIMNPGQTEAKLSISYITEAPTVPQQLSVPPRSRITLDINALLAGMDISFEIESDQAIAVERPLYCPGVNFEVTNALDNLGKLSVDIGPRVEGTAGDEAAANYLAAALRSYGYHARIDDVPLPTGSHTHNIIGEPDTSPLPAGPSTAMRGTLVVGAHYDTKLGTGSPGANDNGSGTVVVLELARCFSNSKADIRFVFFGGEEQLVNGTEQHHFGSRYYVGHMSQGEKDHFMGAIIVDMVGVGSQLYARTMGIGPMSLCNSLLAYAAGTGYYLPYLRSGSSSDHEAFESAGLPAVWLEYKDDPWYHTPADSFEKVQPAYIEHVGQLLESYIYYLIRGVPPAQ